MARVEAEGADLLGPDGLLGQVTKAVLERALDEELTVELGYEKGDPAGRGSGNSRNGTTPKRVHTEIGTLDLDIPRDRNGDFEPKIVPKGATRLNGFNERIIALYARGVTVRDIQAHLAEIYGVEVSPDLISKVTDAVWDELEEWRNRPLDAIYPIIYIDALVIKIRDGMVQNRPAYLAVGVDLEGRKHVLGIWIGDTEGEGAKFWLSVLTELRNRGVDDVLIVCCDGLKGLPDAIEATWPQAVTQTCVIHLLRASFRYAGNDHRKKVAAQLKPVYTAPSLEAAEAAFAEFEAGLGQRYPAIVKLWRDQWETFVPFLAFPAEVRRVVYTTNMIESINYQLRKVTKNRGHFPNERAALKLLYLAVRNITTERGGPAGTGTWGWTSCLNQLAIYFPGRFNIA
ncbi:MAG: IS256 family transposase [Acidimicrobiales bacterium]|nr:IS256 family transposase [Acidimicrobiales bacterium]